jgi:hypothetical protein
MLAEGRDELPAQKVLACHHCDNPSCVNPKHLYWGSHKQNARDASQRGLLISGERHVFRTNPERCARGEGKPLTAKLTENAIRSIRVSTFPNKVLAHHWGVTPSTISLIRARKRWAHVL